MIGINDQLLKQLGKHGRVVNGVYAPEPTQVLQNCMGKTIKKAYLVAQANSDDYYDSLYLEFTCGYSVIIYDGGQQCCETRYMRTDDDLNSFVGSIMHGIGIKNTVNTQLDFSKGDGEEEIQFLEIMTSTGCFTMASHNEHNGYYSGFSINVKNP